MSNNKKYPNVVYILADDMGYGDISAYNENAGFTTPHLDKMCERGMKFTDAHATSAVCTPSRYSILTGRYNWRSELKMGVLGGYSRAMIEKGRKTVATLFKEKGYYTACIGKWHLGMDFATEDNFSEKPDFDYCDGVDYSKPIVHGPITKGFDYFYGISGSLDMSPYVYIEQDRFTQIPQSMVSSRKGKEFYREGPISNDFVHEEVLDHCTSKAQQVIKDYKDTPFFLYLPLTAPHTPILPHDKFKGKSNTNEYGDFVLHCDDVVGRINKTLEEFSLLEDTIVIFTSDNGCSYQAGFEELLAKGHNPNYHFRGSKSDIFEGGHRVPLIVQYPKEIPSHTSSDSTVCLSDFFATMADFLDVPIADNEAEDSVSMRSILEESERVVVRDHIVHQSIDGSLSIRIGVWKLEMCPGSGGWSYPRSGSEEEKYLPSLQLYNLEDDIGETNNVFDVYPGKVDEMITTLTDIILKGRSTQGTRQSNNGAPIWETIQWLKERTE